MTVLRCFPTLCAAGTVVALATACARGPIPPPAAARPVAAGPVAAGAPAAAAGPAAAPAAAPAISAAQLRNYLTAVEAVRLPVNQLLNQADPILDGYREHRITPAVAADRMDALEEQFAALAVEMDTIALSNPVLARINAPYAHTYVLEDTYLSALASGLADGNLDSLPTTQNQQRQAIVGWRIALQVAAVRAGVTLPADIEQAGRGEIAPNLTGS
jgi:hypothetical protein